MKSNHYRALLLLVASGTTAPAHATFPGLDSDGSFNSGFGSLTLQFVSGEYNTASGYQALYANTTGASNTAHGSLTLTSNTTGEGNTASGAGALFSNTSGGSNTATGWVALAYNTTGTFNVASVSGSLYANISGSYNVGVGSRALTSNTTGNENTACGDGALYANTTGSYNIAVGTDAGRSLSTGSYNIDIGNRGLPRDTNVIRIGKQGTQLKTFIAGIKGVTIAKGTAVMVNSSGQLGVQTSSRRFKQDIQPMGDASVALLKLEPVTFRYKDSDEQGHKPVQFGLIADDVAKIFPELVVYDEAGRPETVTYQALSSLLLNEFQKEQARSRKGYEQLQSESTAHARKAADGLAALGARLAAREQEVATLRAEFAELKQITRQLMAERLASASLAEITP